MTTCTYPIWFDPMSRKRALPNDPDEQPRPSSSRKIKRRRCTGLESGLAHLNLNNSSFLNKPSLAVSASTSVPMPALPIIHPSSVEEPKSPKIPEVKMQTWYEVEKDRIVITDLNDCDDDETPPPSSQVIIPPAFLDHFRNSSTRNIVPGDASKALVLYRPAFSLGAASAKESDGEGKVEDEAVTSMPPQPPQEDDAMDVDP